MLSDEAYTSLPGPAYTYFQRRLSEAVGSDCDRVVDSRSGFIESSKNAPLAGSCELFDRPFLPVVSRGENTA